VFLRLFAPFCFTFCWFVVLQGSPQPSPPSSVVEELRPELEAEIDQSEGAFGETRPSDSTHAKGKAPSALDGHTIPCHLVTTNIHDISLISGPQLVF
jgi:hypothetical protein